MEGVTVPTRPGVPRRGVRREAPSTAPERPPAEHDRRPDDPPVRIRGGSTGRTTASWRVVVLILVLVMALAVLLPSLRAYARQRDRLAELRADAEAAATEVANLEAELARWDDPAYVIAQARERFNYVLPGETPYRVIDPETVTGAPEEVVEPDAPVTRDGVSWYSVVWDSLENPEET
jgi:cell division protein FtsB